MTEPRYSAAERRARRAEVEILRDQAVDSWNRDDGTADHACAIVMITFAKYLEIITRAERRVHLEGDPL
jgi:hypothetical protein